MVINLPFQVSEMVCGAVLRVRMPLEVYPCAWIVTPFRSIFSIVNILAWSRSNQPRILSLHNQLRILSFIPFLFVFKNMIFFVIYMSSKRPLSPPFWIVPWLLPSALVRKELKPSVRDSSRFLINHTKNKEQIKLNSCGLKWIENLC